MSTVIRSRSGWFEREGAVFECRRQGADVQLRSSSSSSNPLVWDIEGSIVCHYSVLSAYTSLAAKNMSCVSRLTLLCKQLVRKRVQLYQEAFICSVERRFQHRKLAKSTLQATILLFEEALTSVRKGILNPFTRVSFFGRGHNPVEKATRRGFKFNITREEFSHIHLCELQDRRPVCLKFIRLYILEPSPPKRKASGKFAETIFRTLPSRRFFFESSATNRPLSIQLHWEGMVSTNDPGSGIPYYSVIEDVRYTTSRWSGRHASLNTTSNIEKYQHLTTLNPARYYIGEYSTKNQL
ncbi:hypothetical protein J6590_085935 [Homalodisca vitripennis]|nr:hypothetical protein J6590_085935 [Homalodisca vitripennis]